MMTVVATVIRLAVAIFVMLFLRRRRRDDDDGLGNVYCSFFFIITQPPLFSAAAHPTMHASINLRVDRYLSTEDGRLRLLHNFKGGNGNGSGRWMEGGRCEEEVQ